jgi:hypothetical protein
MHLANMSDLKNLDLIVNQVQDNVDLAKHGSGEYARPKELGLDR